MNCTSPKIFLSELVDVYCAVEHNDIELRTADETDSFTRLLFVRSFARQR